MLSDLLCKIVSVWVIFVTILPSKISADQAQSIHSTNSKDVLQQGK